MASSRNRRLLKFGLAAAAVATAGGSFYMRDSPWWSSLAPVRFGRAASAVSCTESGTMILFSPFYMLACAGADSECRLQVVSEELRVWYRGVLLHYKASVSSHCTVNDLFIT